MKKLSIFAVISMLLLASCASHNNKNKHLDDVVSISGLLDSSSEQITVDLQSESSISQLSEWIENDQPSRAELSCFEGYKNCMEAKKVLNSYGVSFSYSQAPNKHGNVSLIYDRVVARDCLDKTDSNGHMQTGCSTSSNILQMISNYKQIIQPSLSDSPRSDDFMKR